VSDRFKHAFKVALAMVIAYGIALGMDWDKPFWAALSVAFCSLATAGDSLNRGIERVGGTLLACIVTLTLIALFPQDRWPFLLSMSAFIALCTYLMSDGSRFFYFWFVAGFSVPLLSLLSGGTGLNSFETVILRTQETALGVIVYSLVAVLLWPRSGSDGLKAAVRTVCAAQHQLFRQYLGIMTGSPDDGDAARLRALTTGNLNGLSERLEGAVFDSYEIWEMRHTWRRFVHQLSALSSTMERWRLGFDDLKDLDLQALIPGLMDFGIEIDARLAEIENMGSGEAPQRHPRRVALYPDQDKLRTLSHFQQAAVLMCCDQLTRMGELTEALFEYLSNIRGHDRARVGAPASAPSRSFPVIDLDRLAVTVRQSTTLWLTLLLVIYVPELPNPIGMIVMANAIVMFMSLMPQVQSGTLFLPSLLSTAFGGALYLFVMPRLSGFLELGVVIFAATFLIGYIFYAPQSSMAKSLGLCMLVVIIGVENQQTYSFSFVANWFLAFPVIGLAAISLASHFPVSFRPEHRFLALLSRFFHSCEVLMSTPHRDPQYRPSRLTRWRTAFHRREVATLPGRLAAWGQALPPAALGTATQDRVQAFVTGLQALGNRLDDLLEARTRPQSEEVVRALLDDVRTWRIGVQRIFGDLAARPEAADHAGYRARLDARLALLEARIAETLDTAETGAISTEEAENMYRVLGAHRGVSEALVAIARHAAPIDWPRLREARF
jgi:hypothetical protein